MRSFLHVLFKILTCFLRLCNVPYSGPLVFSPLVHSTPLTLFHSPFLTHLLSHPGSLTFLYPVSLTLPHPIPLNLLTLSHSHSLILANSPSLTMIGLNLARSSLPHPCPVTFSRRSPLVYPHSGPLMLFLSHTLPNFPSSPFPISSLWPTSFLLLIPQDSLHPQSLLLSCPLNLDSICRRLSFHLTPLTLSSVLPPSPWPQKISLISPVVSSSQRLK